MYQSIYELPSQVQASLSEEDQAIWMDAYNGQYPSTPEEAREAKKEAWKMCKDLPSSFSFHIWATVQAVDKDREIVDVDSVARHMDSFIDYGGNVQWEHGNYNVATIWDWELTKKDGRDAIAVWGNVFGGDKVYDQMRRTFIEGKNSLSVAGEADKGKFVCDENGCYTRRDVKQVMEISFCAVPSNKYCTLIWYNKDASLAKSESSIAKSAFSEDGFSMNVDGYEIHRDEGNCPLCLLRKSLQAQGFRDAYITKGGVKVDLGFVDYCAALPRLRDGGNYVEWTGTGALVKDYTTMLEKAFKTGHSLGYIDDEGNLTGMIAKCQFEDLYRKGMLEPTEAGFRLKRRLYAD